MGSDGTTVLRQAQTGPGSGGNGSDIGLEKHKQVRADHSNSCTLSLSVNSGSRGV